MRKKVIAGNWKMNMLPNEAIEYIEKFEPLVKDTQNEVILCVPYTDLFYALLSAQNTNIKIGAQNMHFAESGAYTGEVSGLMLKSIGTTYVIIGHSERRAMFNETDETVNLKLKKAFEVELLPILCVGESLEQRETGKTEEVLKNQIVKDLEGLTKEQVKELVIAYEPIWAIGTGKTATSQIADETCGFIRKTVGELFGEEVSEAIRIQYGGSVKTSNIEELMSMPNIDGALIGGASLKAEDFIKLVYAAAKQQYIPM